MTIEEKIIAQEKECARLLELAHSAPFAEYSMDHRGHTAIIKHTNSWATRGDEYIFALNKLQRLRTILTG